MKKAKKRSKGGLLVAALAAAGALAAACHDDDPCTGAGCPGVVSVTAGYAGNAGATGSDPSLPDAGGSPDETPPGGCTTDSECAQTVSCVCPDQFTTTTTDGTCQNGACFSVGDDAVCDQACLTHSAP